MILLHIAIALAAVAPQDRGLSRIRTYLELSEVRIASLRRSSDALRDEIDALASDLVAIRGVLDRIDSGPVAPPPDVDPPADPPPDVTEPPRDPPTDPGDTMLERARRIRPPPIAVPTRAEWDWIVGPGGSATNMRTLDELEGIPNPVGYCVRQHSGAGPLVVAIRGEQPGIFLCNLLRDETAPETATTRTPGIPLDVTFVGIDESAAIRGIVYGTEGPKELKYGKLGRFRLFDLTITCPYGRSAALLQQGRVYGDVEWHGITYESDANQGGSLGYDGAGMKWGAHVGHGVDGHLFISGFRRGTDNLGRPQRYREHWLYVKSPGAMFLVGNDMSGGNRTGFQASNRADDDRPHGPQLIEGNVIDGLGVDWTKPDGSWFDDGGSAVTVWGSPGYATVIRGNRITNSRYGCIAVAHEPPGQGPFLTPSGHSHRYVVIEGNVCTQHPAAKRSAVSVNSCERVDIVGNEIDGAASFDLSIDGSTAAKWGAPRSLDVNYEGPLPPDLAIGTYDRDTGQSRLMTPLEILALRPPWGR